MSLTHLSFEPLRGVGLLCILIIRNPRRPVTATRANFSYKSQFPICSVCSEAVELRTDKTDETGKPIHEECHAQKARSKATQKLRSSDSTEDSQENLSQAIVSFLDSICNPSDDLKHCPVCGSDFEYRDCSLFYNGRSWMKRLPVCFQCFPVQQ